MITFAIAVYNHEHSRWVLGTCCDIILFHALMYTEMYCACLFQITQIEFSERAPAGCRQYYQGNSGVYVQYLLLSFAELTMFERNKN